MTRSRQRAGKAATALVVALIVLASGCGSSSSVADGPESTTTTSPDQDFSLRFSQYRVAPGQVIETWIEGPRSSPLAVGVDLNGVDADGARFVLISAELGLQPSYWRHGRCSDCAIYDMALPAARHYGIVIPKEAATGTFTIERSLNVSYDAESGTKTILVRSSIEIV